MIMMVDDVNDYGVDDNECYYHQQIVLLIFFRLPFLPLPPSVDGGRLLQTTPHLLVPCIPALPRAEDAKIAG